MKKLSVRPHTCTRGGILRRNTWGCIFVKKKKKKKKKEEKVKKEETEFRRTTNETKSCVDNQRTIKEIKGAPKRLGSTIEILYVKEKAVGGGRHFKSSGPRLFSKSDCNISAAQVTVVFENTSVV